MPSTSSVDRDPSLRGARRSKVDVGVVVHIRQAILHASCRSGE